jgi:phosphate transport system permease protein
VAQLALLWASVVVVLGPVLFIVGFLLAKGLPAVTPSFLFQPPRGGMRRGGIFPAIVGTLYLTVGTAIIALPLGVLSAIYLTQYSRASPLTRVIRLAIVNLAGVPSVVFGLFGLGLFVLTMRMGTSLLAGCLTLALLILPVIITASEEAILAVPAAFRDASLALGATRWQTVWRIILPNAMPGILTGTIIGLSRAAGETAPILLTVAAFYLPRLPTSLFDQAMALPYHLYIISTQVPNAPPRVQWGTAAVLLLLVLSLNLLAATIRARLRRRRKW